MTLSLNPATLTCMPFTGMVTPQPPTIVSEARVNHYLQAFCQANGKPFVPEDSRVREWLSGENQVSFTTMAEALVSQIVTRTDLSDLDMVILAHWTPDAELGQAVTNYVLHRLALEDTVAFALSDAGLVSPFMALDCIERYLPAQQGKALLLVMDQNSLMSHSPAVDRHSVANAASGMVIERNGSGLQIQTRIHDCTEVGTETILLQQLSEQFGLTPESTTVICEPEIAARLSPQRHIRCTRPDLLCVAPFWEMQQAIAAGDGFSQSFVSKQHFVLLSQHQGKIYTLMATSGHTR
ncbi:hypothetical protein SBX64_12680 [Vibrio rhizosphaerae]|uniref:Beta-ketoacyl-[acyl-carrier-protein] synthase III N-terminal domain-containing protein n=1 Tax=Vibrio rhizosphaerae TaxID=398736 RepID=A0ABU4IW99_9VIBR|nr:hypothetical protein [Vibrio rhizosphaerae]MDW6093403.1 hypothetical protein [Vibrio rhizosphaerae]